MYHSTYAPDAEDFYASYLSYDEAECLACGEHPDECACDALLDGDFGGEDAAIESALFGDC